MPDLKKYDYLLGMSMWMLTEERKNELLRQKDSKMTELDILKKKTNGDLWREDLDTFMDELDKLEKKELAEINAEMKEKQTAVSYDFKLLTFYLIFIPKFWDCNFLFS